MTSLTTTKAGGTLEREASVTLWRIQVTVKRKDQVKTHVKGNMSLIKLITTEFYRVYRVGFLKLTLMLKLEVRFSIIMHYIPLAQHFPCN